MNSPTSKQQFTRNFLRLAGVTRETTPEENEMIWTKLSVVSIDERSLLLQYLKKAQHTPKDGNIIADFEEIMSRIKQ